MYSQILFYRIWETKNHFFEFLKYFKTQLDDLSFQDEAEDEIRKRRKQNVLKIQVENRLDNKFQQ